MSDIELIVKIPEEAYKLLKNGGVDWLGAEHILTAVANGIPLQKGQSVTPTERTGYWIPVSERLPNLDDFTGEYIWQKKVLITGYLSFDHTKNLFVTEAFAKDVVYNSVHDIVVTAWMPLPKPYKPESEE